MEGMIFIGMGAIALVGGFWAPEWFMNHHKARFLTKILGHSGTRVFYILVGATCATVGVLMLTGKIKL